MQLDTKMNRTVIGIEYTDHSWEKSSGWGTDGPTMTDCCQSITQMDYCNVFRESGSGVAFAVPRDPVKYQVWLKNGGTGGP